MPINRRELLKASVAATAILRHVRTATAAPAEGIQVAIDAAKVGEPISPLIFGGYMEPATTRIWAEMLTDRKFANPIVPAERQQQQPASPMRRFMGEPFRPVGPAGTVEMDRERPFVGKHSPRVKLDGSEPHGIQQSRLRMRGGKSYVGRVYLKGDPGAKVIVRLVWGPGPNDSQSIEIPPLSRTYQKFPLSFTPKVDTQEGRLEILGTGSGTFHIGAVSLMPGDNIQGFHAGMVRYLREAGFKMVKWPGGNFVSGYDWYDGIGDIDKRPPRHQAMWNSRVEPNDIGLHEFITLCRLLGAEPNVTVNSGFGSAREAAEEVEYCNSSTDTRLGKLRADNGHPEPFKVRLWTIGNEMYGPWQFGRMSLNQYWEKHNRIVEAMRAVDPDIKVVLSGATICERSIGGAEKKGNFFPSEWEPPIPEDLPWEIGSHEDWTGWLLKNCLDNVDYVSEHTYSYPRLAYDSKKQRFVDVQDPLPIQARRASNRIGEAMEVWRVYAEKMPELTRKGVKFIFDEWGCRHRTATGASYQPPGMLTPLAYAMFMNEMFRNSNMVAASCATGSFGTVLIDNTGEATGYSAEGLVLKLMHNHFGDAMPVHVGGNSPQQPVPGTPWVDIPKVPIGSPTFPLDVVAALSPDRKRLIISVVNPTETAQEFSPRLTGIKLKGPGKLWQIAPPSLNSSNQPGRKPEVEIVEHTQQSLTGTVRVPPVSVSVYEFEVATA
ncbi:MAG: alpha-N-arabinofuranosidase [bacterium]|jgi:alpha-N-arabinofuranosidase